ncbi:uncharacterized [Tachysurus ichikawai]
MEIHRFSPAEATKKLEVMLETSLETSWSFTVLSVAKRAHKNGDGFRLRSVTHSLRESLSSGAQRRKQEGGKEHHFSVFITDGCVR